MLVLTRKPGERIIIGDDIVITLISIRRDDEYGDRIRIGLEAPSEVPIRREEVPQQRKPDQPASVESSLDCLEVEGRRVRQKIEALGCQIARESRQAAPDAERASGLSDAMVSLRRRCDQLLEQLGRIASGAGNP